MTATAWICLRVRSQYERWTAGVLREKGLMAYVPVEVRMVERRGLRHRKPIPRTFALIPGYVFVLITGDDDLETARSVRSVIEVMSDDFGNPRAVDLHRLRGLFLAEWFRLFDVTYEPPKPKGYTRRWKAGDRVKVASGVMEGWVGQVLAPRGERSVTVMFMAFGEERGITIPESALAAVAEAADA